MGQKWDFEGKWTWNRAFSKNGYGKGTFGYKREILVKMVFWKNVPGKGLGSKMRLIQGKVVVLGKGHLGRNRGIWGQNGI